MESDRLFSEALDILPGGVNSPVRAFRAVGGRPIFVKSGKGPYLFDVDGNRYIDYVLSWGPLALGHAHPEVVEALTRTAAHGTSFGAPTEQETQLALLIRSLMPSLEMIRFVNSGTEATMSALRLARAFTGRTKILKFEGHYHGHSDHLLARAGSGVATLGLPDSPGVNPRATRDTLVARFNDLQSVRALLEQNPGEVAAVILEPVAGNMGLVLPQTNFLQDLRALTNEYGIMLIFDEVMTGFRVSLGGVQGESGVNPDLTTLGKVIGGGLPVGAYGGRRDIMEWVAPQGPVYQAGTLSGNPLAMAAGLATLRHLTRPGVWSALETNVERLLQGLKKSADEAEVDLHASRAGSMFGIFFGAGAPVDWESASRVEQDRYARFFNEMLSRGVYVAPSAFEAAFFSTAHDDVVVDRTLEEVRRVFRSWSRSGE